MEIIKELMDKLRNEGKMSKEDALEFARERITAADIESYFRVIINWTRHAGLIGYDSDSAEIYLIYRE